MAMDLVSNFGQYQYDTQDQQDPAYIAAMKVRKANLDKSSAEVGGFYGVGKQLWNNNPNASGPMPTAPTPTQPTSTTPTTTTPPLATIPQTAANPPIQTTTNSSLTQPTTFQSFQTAHPWATGTEAQVTANLKNVTPQDFANYSPADQAYLRSIGAGSTWNNTTPTSGYVPPQSGYPTSSTGGTQPGTGTQPGAFGNPASTAPVDLNNQDFLRFGGAALTSLITALSTGGTSAQMAIPAILAAWQQYTNSDSYQQLGAQAAATADPFGNQRGAYQDKLWQIYNNPTAVLNDPAHRAVVDNQLNTIQARNRAGGYLGSGKDVTDMANYQAQADAQYLDQEKKQLGDLSGAQFSPANAGNFLLEGGRLALQSKSAALDTLMRPATAGMNADPNNNGVLGIVQKALSSGSISQSQIADWATKGYRLISDGRGGGDLVDSSGKQIGTLDQNGNVIPSYPTDPNDPRLGDIGSPAPVDSGVTTSPYIPDNGNTGGTFETIFPDVSNPWGP